MGIYNLNGTNPKIHESCWIAPSADIIGDVTIHSQSTVWFNVTIRGDVMPIKIGSQTNIQDGSTLHGTMGQCGVQIGDRVTVGHNVILHGCDIEDECLIGMGSVVMDKARIPKGSIVGAGSLVTEGSHFEEGMLILGSPAKAIRCLKPKEKEFLSVSANNYIEYSQWYQEK